MPHKAKPKKKRSCEKMKYVINGYSPAMLSDYDVLIIQKELSYEEFKALCYGAKSMVGHKDLAKCLGLEYNPGNIIINPDDVCISIFTKGGKLPKHFKDLSEIELRDIELRFVCMQFIKN